ncbi:hypothetical protein F4805DRAFT_416436 [Annulohypoxylon moriforme]|nr:hypothetical protein F4805DRAFT_416436 [Annulohypoxylon moriforme]
MDSSGLWWWVCDDPVSGILGAGAIVPFSAHTGSIISWMKIESAIMAVLNMIRCSGKGGFLCLIFRIMLSHGIIGAYVVRQPGYPGIFQDSNAPQG